MQTLHSASPNPYAKMQNSDVYSQKYSQIDKTSENNMEKTRGFDADAVSVQISTMNILAYISDSTTNNSKTNFDTQKFLTELINGNEDFINFFNGKETKEGFSLDSIGYDGKPISELSPTEAKDLISDEGFFGISQTSDRVSNFAITIAGDDVEALQKARDGIVQGFEEANKLFGGELPEISYKTQERTLQLIDKKIDELSNT